LRSQYCNSRVRDHGCLHALSATENLAMWPQVRGDIGDADADGDAADIGVCIAAE